MIELGLVIATIALFGLPAAAVGTKRLADRWQAQREAAREQLERERERREAAARTEQERIDTLWREHPDIGGLTEYLRYIHLRRGQLDRDRADAHDDFEQRKEDVDALTADRGGERVPSGHRVLVLVALVLFALVLCLGVALDYLIFRGLHPGTVVLPLGLACLAVFGIMTGSVIFLGVSRHKLLPASSGLYVRLTLRLFGLMLAGGVALYMTAIAPYRSAAAGQARIDSAVSTVQNAKTSVPPAPPIVIAQDQRAVTQARASLREAQRVDQLSAATLAFLEIPLTEGAVLGAELLIFDLARKRRDQARQVVREIEGETGAAEAQFANDLMGVLVARGHDETVIPHIMSRMQRLQAAWTGQPVQAHGLPPGSADGQVPAPDDFAAGGTGDPGDSTPGYQPHPGYQPDPGAAAGPGGGMRPGASAAIPAVTVVDPAGGPSDLAPVTRLEPAEHNQTR
jgi:hypothetical protein